MAGTVDEAAAPGGEVVIVLEGVVVAATDDPPMAEAAAPPPPPPAAAAPGSLSVAGEQWRRGMEKEERLRREAAEEAKRWRGQRHAMVRRLKAIGRRATLARARLGAAATLAGGGDDDDGELAGGAPLRSKRAAQRIIDEPTDDEGEGEGTGRGGRSKRARRRGESTR